MANGVRFFAALYWKIDQCAERAAPNPYCYQAEPNGLLDGVLAGSG
jgi:hypothetical protein